MGMKSGGDTAKIPLAPGTFSRPADSIVLRASSAVAATSAPWLPGMSRAVSMTHSAEALVLPNPLPASSNQNVQSERVLAAPGLPGASCSGRAQKRQA